MDANLSQNHYFALFGMPVAFDIDKDALKQNLLSLQKQHHPDSQNGDDLRSDLINRAYQTLSRDDWRALYLLEMAGVAVNLDQSIDDVDFLHAMMEYRAQLAENTADRAAVLGQLASDKDRAAAQFLDAYQNRHWEAAQTYALKLKFIAKIFDDESDRPLENSDNDDDLYV